jgi:hypothetical protein
MYDYDVHNYAFLIYVFTVYQIVYILIPLCI